MSKQYRVVEKSDSDVSPFPDEVWETREAAQEFVDTAPDGWAGRLIVVEVDSDEKS